MWRQMLKAKIHRATVTDANLNYMGSITLDKTLLDACGIREYEKVQVVNINNGARFETYVICGKADSGIVTLNGAAARLVQPGDKVIIISYCLVTEDELDGFQPVIVFVDERNRVITQPNLL
ncbi:MAG: aspartate 1-decarboxylase [Candidatus Auribacterota bacterium]|jgi:aspartate 1-decarboxylase|nr:aspartate 1-decarboxylase [Candidatus Auribacterota bacterium]